MANSLLACPFCRELYGANEADTCPVCGMDLKPLVDLPPSFEVMEQQALDWEQTDPTDRTLPWADMRHGKGLLLAASSLGLGLFFAPWLVMSMPHAVVQSGYDLATTRGFWFAGGAVAWFINLALVASRRTLNQMRGVVVIVTLFSSLTACQALLLWVLAPRVATVPLEYEWGWGFYASAALSLFSLPIACRFGRGPAFASAPPSEAERSPRTPQGETLH